MITRYYRKENISRSVQVCPGHLQTAKLLLTGGSRCEMDLPLCRFHHFGELFDTAIGGAFRW